MNSRIPGLYERSPSRRLEVVAAERSLRVGAAEAIRSSDSIETLDGLSENVVGSIGFPLSVATNFVVDGADKLVPMATEESSVVAAASHGAKLARETGGFRTTVSGPHMIGQIQLRDMDDPGLAVERLESRRAEIRDMANDQGVLVSHGGGCEDVDVRVVETPRGEMIVVHLVVNVLDAMGANAVNTMCEGVAPLVASIAEGTPVLRILSNLADRRVATAECRLPPTALDRDDSELSGEAVRDRILDAWALAVGDPYRAATHNKGILNGMDALAVATMNDWRAIEAGAHAFAARGGYGPLSSFGVDESGRLTCRLEVPVQVGTVGGATGAHPTASAAMELLDVDSADEFAGIFAAVGLATNVASLRALADEGIQPGHMKLHAKNLAREAGATGELVDVVADRMIAEDDVRMGRARELVDVQDE